MCFLKSSCWTILFHVNSDLQTSSFCLGFSIVQTIKKIFIKEAVISKLKLLFSKEQLLHKQLCLPGSDCSTHFLFYSLRGES